MPTLKKALLFHDFSAFSKSGLTVAIPVLEALGLEAGAIPTCLLSTQTDGFGNLFIRDLSSDAMVIYEKIKSEGYSFDYIYSGFVENDSIYGLLEKVIDEEKDAFVLVDPVLGDGGKLYEGMTGSHVEKMRNLIRKADLITPNLTEALLLTGIEGESSYSNGDLKALFDALSSYTEGDVVMTSVPLEIGGYSNVAFKNGDMRIFPFPDVPVGYPGSGDLFASLLLGLLSRGNSFFPSVKIAGELSSEVIRRNWELKRERRLGVSLSPLYVLLKERVP